MKICLLTNKTPWPENRGGITALEYYMIKYRPKDVDIDIISFNFNSFPEDDIQRMRDDLKSQIKIVRHSWWNKLLLGSSVFTRFFIWVVPLPHFIYLKVPKWVKREIQSKEYDVVWLYPYIWVKLAWELPSINFVITGPDCESLNKIRRMSDPVFMNGIISSFHSWVFQRQDIRLENRLNRPNIMMHYVGLNDKLFYERHTKNNNSFWVEHPHYKVEEKKVCFSEKKLRIIIPGEYNFFMKTDIDFMVEDFVNKSNELKEKISIVFLGKKWECVSEILINAGYECEHKKWVDDYIKEIVKYDVQITPISNGAGTKAKVLDALANGLLVIASDCAAENIRVSCPDSILIYRTPNQISLMLDDVYINRKHYEQVAEKGRDLVLKYHDPQRVSSSFVEEIKSYFSNNNS